MGQTLKLMNGHVSNKSNERENDPQMSPVNDKTKRENKKTYPSITELNNKYGKSSSILSSNAFFARSYEEDCFLVPNRNKLMNLSCRRHEWVDSKQKYVVACELNGEVIKLFGHQV